MKTEVTTGRVIYCFVGSDATADINLVCQKGAGVMGFKVATHALKNPEKALDLLMHIKKGDDIRLTVCDKQLTEIFLPSLGRGLSIATYPNLGMSLKESASKTVKAQFVQGSVHQFAKNSVLQLCVRGAEKSIYEMEADKSEKARQNVFLQKCQKGDMLRIYQNPEGKITQIVNESQALEFV